MRSEKISYPKVIFTDNKGLVMSAFAPQIFLWPKTVDTLLCQNKCDLSLLSFMY